MDKEKRKKMVLEYKKLQYLKDLAIVQWKYRKMFDDKNFDQWGALPSALRKDQLVELVRSARAAMRNVPKAGDRKARVAAITQEAIRGVMNLQSGRRDCYVTLGSGLKVDVKKYRSGNTYNVYVGWMWMKRVYEPLYKNTTKELGPWFILSALKMRVNDRNIDVYEVMAFNRNTDEVCKGYVAQSKTPARNTTFSPKATVAVKRANEMLSKELNRTFLGNEESEN